MARVITLRGMLRRFLYLDSTALAQYVAAIEGGLMTQSTRRSSRSGSAGGGINAKIVKASGEKSREDEDSRTLADTDEARFDRLLQAARAQPDALGWVEILNPDGEFDGMAIGAMMSWECDLYVPDVVQALASSGEARETLEMMQKLLPSAQSLGLDTQGLPRLDEIEAMTNLVTSLQTKLIVVGESDDTDWRVAGQLNDDFRFAEAEDRAVIVGKVIKSIAPGHSKPFVTFPGMNLLPREQRRKMERMPPPEGKEAEYLAGPALMLDVLAIYH